MPDILYSGGAEGADLEFGAAAKAVGHVVIHYSFRGVRKFQYQLILSDIELREADPYLRKANGSLKRTFPAISDFTNNLLRRNYWQIKRIRTSLRCCSYS